jgi:hypothetical protein
MASHPLNERASGTPVGGALTISFPAPPTGRIWQGSITIPTAVATDSWLLTIGSQLYAIIGGGGPFGPMQISAGQVLTLTWVAVFFGSPAPTTPYTAVLTGIDDSSDDPSPYSGPTALPASAPPSTAAYIGTTVPLFADLVGGIDHNHDLQALFVDTQGIPYAIPSAPSTAAGDHPPNELLVLPFINAGSGVVLAAPGAGKRYRIFGGNIVSQDASAASSIVAVFGGVNGYLATCRSAADSVPFTVPLSGIPTDTNSAISVLTDKPNIGTGVIYYTIEIETV